MFVIVRRILDVIVLVGRLVIVIVLVRHFFL